MRYATSTQNLLRQVGESPPGGRVQPPLNDPRAFSKEGIHMELTLREDFSCSSEGNEERNVGRGKRKGLTLTLDLGIVVK